MQLLFLNLSSNDPKIISPLIVGSFQHQHKPISMFDGWFIKSIEFLYSTQWLSNFLRILWTLATNQTLIRAILFGIPRIFDNSSLRCVKKHIPQSQPRFNIVLWFAPVRSLGFIYNMLALIWVNQCLDKVGLPINWLTNVLLNILDSLTST